MGRAPRDILEEVLASLELEDEGGDAFAAPPGPGPGGPRLFGGMVAAQAVVAAARTVEAGRPLHSLHAYFLRPGQKSEPLRFEVDRLRDGRSFSTRRVVVTQAGETLLNMSASFTRPEEGVFHQMPMPEAPPPDGLEDREDMRLRMNPDGQRLESAVEVRVCDRDLQAGVSYEPRQCNWLRVRGEVPDEPIVQTALLVYASDHTVLTAAARAHGQFWGTASLDHAVWIHRPYPLNGWVLYATESPAAHAARGIVFGGIFSPDGTRIASVAQEGIFRSPRSR